jgi:hypothetical protein
MPPKGMPGCLPPSCGLCAFCYKKKYKDLLGLVAFAFFSIDNTDQKNDQYWKERATRIKEKEICLAYSPKRKYRNPRYKVHIFLEGHKNVQEMSCKGAYAVCVRPDKQWQLIP